MKALTLDDVLKLSTGPTAIKMDIEGAEHRVLKKAKLDNIEAISLEVHGDPSEVLRALRKQGFEMQIYTPDTQRALGDLAKGEPKSVHAPRGVIPPHGITHSKTHNNHS